MPRSPRPPQVQVAPRARLACSTAQPGRSLVQRARRTVRKRTRRRRRAARPPCAAVQVEVVRPPPWPSAAQVEAGAAPAAPPQQSPLWFRGRSGGRTWMHLRTPSQRLPQRLPQLMHCARSSLSQQSPPMRLARRLQRHQAHGAAQVDAHVRTVRAPQPLRQVQLEVPRHPRPQRRARGCSSARFQRASR